MKEGKKSRGPASRDGDGKGRKRGNDGIERREEGEEPTLSMKKLFPHLSIIPCKRGFM